MADFSAGELFVAQMQQAKCNNMEMKIKNTGIYFEILTNIN